MVRMVVGTRVLGWSIALALTGCAVKPSGAATDPSSGVEPVPTPKSEPTSDSPPPVPHVRLDPIAEPGGVVKPTWTSPVEDLKLPAESYSELMLEGVPVIITRSGVFAAGKQVASVSEGRIDPAAIEAHYITDLGSLILGQRVILATQARARDEEPSDSMVIFADEGLRFESLVDLLYTGGRSEFVAYEIAVAPQEPSPRAGSSISMYPPRLRTDGSEAPPRAALYITRDRLSFDSMVVPLDPADPGPAIEEIMPLAMARSARLRAGKDLVPALEFSAEPDVELGTIVRILVALTGDDCKYWQPDTAGCIFPLRVVMASRPEPYEGGQRFVVEQP